MLLATLVGYWQIWWVFFQHEEWGAFGNFFSDSYFPFFAPAVAHYVPLTRLLIYIYFQIFRLNEYGYAFVSLASHMVIIFLVYKIAHKLLAKPWLAFLAAGFFALNASSHQATSWLIADINTHMSTFFALLAVLAIVDWKKIWLSTFLLIISLLFKETPIALFVFLPFLVSRNWDRLKIIISGGIYFLFRFSMLFFARSHIDDRLVTETQSVFEVVTNIFTFPAKMFAQSLLPIRLLLSMAKSISGPLPDSVVENVVLQIIYWVIFVGFVGGSYLLIKRSKDTLLKKALIFGFAFFFLNTLIYVLSPGRGGIIPVVDSRNLYFPLIGLSIYLISTLFILLKDKAIWVILILIGIHTIWLNKELVNLANIGRERKAILEQVKLENPKLPKRTVFFMESDKPFYGMAEDQKIFPFQINLGYTFIVWYWPTENFPKGFGDQTKFLHGLTEEGYKEDGDRGVGYFRNFSSLQEAVLKYNLPKESVIAYHYDSGTKKTLNITKIIRNKLK